MNKYTELIDRLADKTLSFGCRGGDSLYPDLIYLRQKEDGRHVWHTPNDLSECVYYIPSKWDQDKFNNYGHPILIGDLIGQVAIAWTEEQQKEQWLELVELWHECGADKSLQEIYSCGVEIDAMVCAQDCEDHKECPGRRLKNPNAQALFDFLLELFPNPLTNG